MQLGKVRNLNYKISVVIPTWNRAGCVERAIDSALKQNPFEVIVVDDGSSDNTFDLLKDRRDIRLLYNVDNLGVNSARNKGVKNAEGDYILFLDSDDQLTDDALKIINEKKLGMVNLFGCKNVDTYEEMFYLKKSDEYCYCDWLEGKDIRGEFLGVYAREVFEDFMFDESLFCFEAFWINKVIKNHWVKAFDDVCRLYSFKQGNRVTKDLLKLRNVKRRYEDYLKFYNEFKYDYEKFDLKKQLKKIKTRVWIYRILSWVFK